MPRASRIPGFTIIEVIAVMAILSVLAVVALPLAELSVTRSKERELRRALWEIRDALDAYKKAVDEGRIARGSNDNGYPANLEVLAVGNRDLEASAGPRQLRFLRRIPRDPMHGDESVPAAASWGIRSFDSPADAPRAGADIYDVYSTSDKVGLNGVPYRRW